ncbi:alpha/beta fold hydrolase [Xinfangfangia pollutisoli]|uniref:alpha/beta fold hydrolase n=1 Tax=Xinfangfangia pollutisoli TaxID=2865960 RepID=UPI001CD7FE24|nr:alpha/beta hydrolase [Xinfangfangia pollutisoli]
MSARLPSRLPGLAALAVALLAACAGPAPAPGTPPPLAPVSGSARAPDSVTFLLPGALTTAQIFGPAITWGDARNLVVEYRLPGTEGQPLSTPLDIDRAAQWVAEYAARYPEARINLMGYSTGAAIALTAAGRISNPGRVKVAALSSATPFPGALLALLRAGPQLAAAALDEGSLNRRRVWENYTITLLLGPGWRQDPPRRARGLAVLDQWRNRIEPPKGGQTRAQARDLLGWTLPARAGGPGPQITFLHGGRDPVFPLPQIRALAGKMGGQICLWPESGHLLYLTAPGLTPRVRDWFFHDRPICGP